MINKCLRCKSTSITHIEEFEVEIDFEGTYTKIPVELCTKCGAISYKYGDNYFTEFYPLISSLSNFEIAANWAEANKTGGKIL